MAGINHSMEVLVGARARLNVAAANGCLIFAAVLGVMFESWAVFFTVAVLLIAGDCYSGLIRPGGTIRRGR